MRGAFYGWFRLFNDTEPQHPARIKQHMPLEDQDTINVNVRTLAWLADKYRRNHVDFMSIDTEGTQKKIMRTFPWAKLSVAVFRIENNYRNFDIDALMAANGYAKGARTGSDDIFYKHALITHVSV